MPCTTILVGKKASYDGSTMIARNDDSGSGHFTTKKLAVVLPKDQPRHYKSVLSHVEVDLPDNPMRYTCIPNVTPGKGVWPTAGVNEDNVAMTATETITSNERVLGADPLVELQKEEGRKGRRGYKPEVPGGIGEEDLVLLTLPYIHSAREGVERLGFLHETYGTYETNGIGISDVNEIWWFESVGGHHWIARRVPDDAYVTMPNELGVDRFSFEDAYGEQKDFMCCPDLKEFVEENHLDLTLGGGEMNPRDAFGSHSDSDHVYNTPRAWAIQRFLNPRTCRWDGPDADFTPESDDIPWCRVPERKLTIEDVKYALSLHYQGTPFDPYSRRGHRSDHGIYRPIGINRNSQLSVVQLRPYRDEAYRAVQWIAFGSNVFNALVPFYANVTTTPAYLAGTDDRVTTENFYWENRVIAALADAHYHEAMADVERYQEKVGGMGHHMLKETDAAAASAADVHAMLEAANEKMAELLKKETDDLLDKVLFCASMGMKNAFSKDDM